MSEILEILLREKRNSHKNGLYHYTQIHFAYNSNHIEESTLTNEQTRLIYEKDIFLANESQIIKTNDILEAKNHFIAFDFILENALIDLDIDFIKNLHFLVKQNCTDIKTIGDIKQPHQVKF
ncbi:cell filamentation protein Fic [Helicobacter cinaedi]|uniref:Fic family protein n=1 Tax=Helicobacter cinaedi CCUG 18818 = ATCC BAA-847 TaxID=537971 RepID=A0AAI8MJV0_9HELI|nr:hypothetical protein [Helicobacter cinaedi]EFR45458.1 hypothetical protein HCCG_00004 [Helicobacter cinaedi CCUG 18818 = ATCC BAA-847]QOQ91200.1 cell filamentation protein Fic [Helicobacter cinaedi]BAM32837.1 conserved hypothetical protein [Helicobacter cinaedi CCUG 18818 = ATCC BAA-847]